MDSSILRKICEYLTYFKDGMNRLYEWNWNLVIFCSVSVMILDNLLSYYFQCNIINDLFDPCSTTLMLIQFMLGIVNIIGFSSFYIQIELILSNGLDPAYLKINKWIRYYPINDDQRNIKSMIEKWTDRLRYKLSVFWLSSNDSFIRFINLFGIFNGFVISLLSLQFYNIGGSISICYLFNSIFYLSLIQISGDFLGLQSDSNLVETNFIMFICSTFNKRYPVICIIILRWLAFRTMLACGICKWHGSRMWKNLTAMIHHYYTQPLPNPISYYVHNCPRWFQEISVVMTFIIEGPLCFGAFGPSWSRYLAFIGFEGINLLINTTGNYGFIGALNMSENMSFLDDNAMFKRFNEYKQEIDALYPISIHWKWWEWILIPIGVGIMSLYVISSWIPLCGTSKRYDLPFQSDELEKLYGKFHKYRLVNYYAKFGSMHEGRYEFVLEGSNDGITWKKYEFLFKPSSSKQIPAIVPLHVPRLDWRTWFLPLYWRRYRSYAYGNYQAPDWWYKLETKLKMNQEEILKLIKYNPFPIDGATYIRTFVHKFDFTDWDQRYGDRIHHGDNTYDEVQNQRIWWITTPQSVLHQ